MQKENDRRQFIKNLGMGAAAVGAGLGLLNSCDSKKPEEKAKTAAAEPKQETIEWKMVTTWPPHSPMLGEGADKLAEWIEKATNGRLKIKVYGGGELVPPLGVFDAVSQGTAQMGHGVSYYWAGKVPAAQFFAAVPFGFNAQNINAWFYAGGGLELWEEAYEKFNVKPYPAGNTGAQMGGWFNKEINSMDDIKGLKMRIPGLGGKVLAKAGGNAVLVAGGEIYTNLDRGVIDATEWVGPFHDLQMGFYKAAKYYYYPGWHECGSALEVLINKDALNALPDDLKEIVDAEIAKANIWMISNFEAKNYQALSTLINEHHVQLRKFPDEVLKEFKKLSLEVLEDIAANDPMSRKVYDSFLSFQKNIFEWNKIAEEPYHNLKHL